MGSQDVEGEFSQQSEVLWGIVFSATAGVFVEDDVEHPVKLVFDAPMGSNDLQEAGGGEELGEDEVARGVVQVKPLRREGGQSECPLGDLPLRIGALLKE